MLTNTDNVFRNTTIPANTVSCFPFPERNNNKYLLASSPQIQTKLVRKLLANNVCRSVLSLYTHPVRSDTLQSQLGNSGVRSLHSFRQRSLRFPFNWSRFCVDSTPWKSTFQGLTCCWGSWEGGGGGPNPDWHTGAKVCSCGNTENSCSVLLGNSADYVTSDRTTDKTCPHERSIVRMSGRSSEAVTDPHSQETVPRPSRER